MDTAKVFTDVLAVNSIKAYASMHPDSERLTATTSEKPLGNGKTSYQVSLRDRLGGGIMYAVDSDLSVRVTPMQGSTDGRRVSLPTETFRWNGQGGPHDGYLEHAVSASDGKTVFVPYANPSLSGGDDAEGGAKLIVDQGLSSVGAGTGNRPAVLMAAEADASREGVRAASESGEFGKLKNGYSQDGPILYNGFSVVEQAGPHGESTFYNKHDLLRNAVDRSTFDHVIESDKPISITIGSNGVSAHSLNSQRPDLHVFRDGKEETLSAGFSQTGKLHDYGAFVGQETTADGHKSVTMFSKKELFEHRTAEEVRALQDAIKHHQSVTIDLSHNAVSIQISERITHANTPARTQSITRKSSSGLERGEP